MPKPNWIVKCCQLVSFCRDVIRPVTVPEVPLHQLTRIISTACLVLCCTLCTGSLAMLLLDLSECFLYFQLHLVSAGNLIGLGLHLPLSDILQVHSKRDRTESWSNRMISQDWINRGKEQSRHLFTGNLLLIQEWMTAMAKLLCRMWKSMAEEQSDDIRCGPVQKKLRWSA